MAQGEHGGEDLDGSRGAETVAGLRFGGADGETAGVIAEDLLDGARLDRIVLRRARAVGIHVIDCLRLDPCFRQRAAHGEDGAAACGIGRGHVVGIRAHPIAGELGEDLRATPARVGFLLEHEHRRAFAEREPGPAPIERAADVRGSALNPA